METEIDARLAALEALTEELKGSIGRCKALEYAVQLLIDVHPDHEKLHARWSEYLLPIADMYSASPPEHGTAPIHRHLQAGLRAVSEAIDARRTRPAAGGA